MGLQLINPLPRLGDPFQSVGTDNAGMPFRNMTGGTISKGQIAAIDIFSTNNGFSDLCPVTGSSQKFPLVVALSDVTASSNSADFAPFGLVGALVLGTTLAKGARVMPDFSTNTTGGTSLIALGATNASSQSAGILYQSCNGTGTLTLVAFDGISARVGGGSGTFTLS